MRKLKQKILMLFLFLTVGQVFYSFGQPPTKKKHIAKLNNMIIVKFFLNFELSEQNGNVPTIVDYIPNSIKLNEKSITMESNMGRNQEKTVLDYEHSLLKKLVYIVSEKKYTYELYFNNNLRIDYITLNGKKKIEIKYNSNNLIKSISRQYNEDNNVEYFIKISEKENKAFIKSFVTINGQRKESKRKSYIVWDNKYYIQEFNFSSYTGKNICYNKRGDLTSLIYSTSENDSIFIQWNYKFNTKDYWSERVSQDNYFKILE